MTRKTTRGELRTVVARWVEQYPTGNVDKTARLRQLDPETATPADVEAIIGNALWTELRCDECGEARDCVIQLGQEPDYESRTVLACGPCLVKALALVPV